VTDPAASGRRIEQLLEASAAAGPAARERAEELVRLVVDLYGAGLERLLDIAYECGALTEDLLAALAADDLVSSLLLVHGLHPYPVEERVEQALRDVRPYLGSHGGDVRLLEVTGDGVVRLALLGSCDGCPSSSVTLSLAVDGAVRAAAPEVVRIDVEEGVADGSTAGTVIPVGSLTARLRAEAPPGTWADVAAVSALPVGSLEPARAAGLAIVLCRLGDTVYAYLDACPSCGAALVGARVERALGSSVGTAVLACARCHEHFDVTHAGAGVEQPAHHLEPLPLLVRDGRVEVAVPSAVPA
jgi:Fe-S cluster biogenesis protein NfuA/nitrite reductase/ring-hydroxylating ferredoxin subunit